MTGDALLTQRKLAQQIVEAGGDYVFPVKENQPQLRKAIQTVFETEPSVKGFSPTPKDFRSAEQVEKGHGRIERRTLTVSSDLKGYVDWPYVEQVFKWNAGSSTSRAANSRKPQCMASLVSPPQKRRLGTSWRSRAGTGALRVTCITAAM